MLTSTLSKLATLAATAALVWAVVDERRAGRGPVVSLASRWFGRGATTPASILVAIAAGLLLVALPLGVERARAGLTWRATDPSPVLDLVVLTVAVKILFVVFEEIAFRGALLDVLGRLGGPQAVVASALVFGLAHAARSSDPSHAAAVVSATIDGIGYGAAAVLTRSLRAPVAWHLAKNLAVWQLTGTSTLQFAPGVMTLVPPESGASGALEPVVAAVVVALTLPLLRALRSRTA